MENQGQLEVVAEKTGETASRRSSDASASSESDHACFEELMPAMMDGQITGDHANEVDGHDELLENQMRSKSHTYSFSSAYHERGDEDEGLSASGGTTGIARQGSMKFGSADGAPARRLIKKIEFEDKPNAAPTGFGRGQTSEARKTALKGKFKVAGKAMMCIGEYSIRRAVAKDMVTKGKVCAV
jgi:hypothetical protein